MKDKTKIEEELSKLLLRRDKIRAKQLASYINGSATRSKTTSLNADVDKMQERIEYLRLQLRQGR